MRFTGCVRNGSADIISLLFHFSFLHNIKNNCMLTHNWLKVYSAKTGKILSMPLEDYNVISCDIKKRLLIPLAIWEDELLPVLPLLFVPASRQKPHQVQQTLYPSAITGDPVTACRCPLNGTFAFRLSHSNRVSNASLKPSSICACTSLSVSELLHKMNLHISLCYISINAIAS